MKYLSAEQVASVSFPDAPVGRFELNKENKLLCFVSDAFVGESPNGKWFDDSTVSITFHDIQIIEEDNKEIQDYNQSYELREICDFQIENNHLYVKGFSKGSGLWTVYILSNPSIDIYYKDYELKISKD